MYTPPYQIPFDCEILCVIQKWISSASVVNQTGCTVRILCCDFAERPSPIRSSSRAGSGVIDILHPAAAHSLR